MSLFDWFANRRKSAPIGQNSRERDIPDGLWYKCESCSAMTYVKDLRTNQMVCPQCNHHIRVTAPDRIEQLIEPGTWQELDAGIHSCDPLTFVDRKPYSDRLKEYRKKTDLVDAIVTGTGKLASYEIALGVMDFRFMGASMGSAVGEKITRLVETATARHLPLILVCASGGARMQEGILSLMQMAKTSAALDRHRQARLLYIPILTHPTTGGVTASFAMLGDLILAEPKAMIGFTGKRVIEQTIRQKLPDEFQTAEYLLEHGFVDAVVPRTQLKQTLATIIGLHVDGIGSRFYQALAVQDRQREQHQDHLQDHLQDNLGAANGSHHNGHAEVTNPNTAIATLEPTLKPIQSADPDLPDSDQHQEDGAPIDVANLDTAAADSANTTHKNETSA
ncbi:Acetyl-coenzyme A carboxylase carboxyl transferase subunit beta [Thalassoporum mexicanum PCC 7367]|nr:Acetyl-coenzyme A carboxylase carboxyl transferase subunit beta [Pseudanabaena sp. PCC 7367]